MLEISSQQFTHDYRFVRHHLEPLVGDWDLYKHKTTGGKRFIKELKFYSLLDADDYLVQLIECPLYTEGSNWDGVLRFLGYVRRTLKSQEGTAYIIICIFEAYDSTLDKLVARRIKDSQSFSPSELYKLLKRVVNIFVMLERFEFVHGDVRLGNIAIMESGELKLIWTPFSLPALKIMQDKPNLIRLMNPSPELCQSYNDSELYREQYSAYPDFEVKVVYDKTDVYSVANMLLRMFALYSKDHFYEYKPALKIVTRRIESTLLKINALNSKFACILNKMLTYDCFERVSFSYLHQVITGQEHPSPLNDDFENLRAKDSERINLSDHRQSNDGLNDSSVQNAGSNAHNINESFGVGGSVERGTMDNNSNNPSFYNDETERSSRFVPQKIDPTFRAFDNIEMGNASEYLIDEVLKKAQPPHPINPSNPSIARTPKNRSSGRGRIGYDSDAPRGLEPDTSRYKLILDKTENKDLEVSPYYSSPSKSPQEAETSGRKPRTAAITYLNSSPRSATRNSLSRSPGRDRETGPSRRIAASQMATALQSFPQNLFENRQLGQFKADLISKIEKVIFFDKTGRLRQGIKIREFTGSKYVGEMFCGKRDGVGIFYYKNGDVYVGRWSMDKMTGDCLYLFNNGSVYAGAVRDDLRQGFGRLMYINGDVYEGSWLKSKKHGRGVYSYFRTGEIYEGDWSLGFKEGHGILYVRGGYWIEGQWKANKIFEETRSGNEGYDHHIPDIVEFYTDYAEWDRMLADLENMMVTRDEDVTSADHQPGVQTEQSKKGSSLFSKGGMIKNLSAFSQGANIEESFGTSDVKSSKNYESGRRKRRKSKGKVRSSSKKSKGSRANSRKKSIDAAKYQSRKSSKIGSRRGSPSKRKSPSKRLASIRRKSGKKLKKKSTAKRKS